MDGWGDGDVTSMLIEGTALAHTDMALNLHGNISMKEIKTHKSETCPKTVLMD